MPQPSRLAMVQAASALREELAQHGQGPELIDALARLLVQRGEAEETVADEVASELVRLALGKRDGTGRRPVRSTVQLAAIREVLDRFHGKPTQHVEANVKANTVTRVIVEMPKDD